MKRFINIPRMSMKTGAEQLVAWIKRQGFRTHQEAARALGMHKGMLSQLINGARRPGLPAAVKLEDQTGIPAKAWLLSASDETATPEPVAESK